MIRSLHSFGVASNFLNLGGNHSKSTCPSCGFNVQILDLDLATASAPMKVTWEASVDAGVEEYRIYVATTDLDEQSTNTLNVDNYDLDGIVYEPVSTVAPSVTEVEISQTTYTNQGQTFASESIQDGQQYWVAVAAIDVYGNATLPSHMQDQQPLSTTHTSQVNWNWRCLLDRKKQRNMY